MSDASWYHHRKAQNHLPEHSGSLFLAGGMIFPPPSGMLDPCQSSSNNWKLISFNSTWLHPKHIFFLSLSLSFSPSLASIYLFKQCLRLGVTSTSSVCLPLQDESLYVFPNCKSLWIKSSAKWLNVNYQLMTKCVNYRLLDHCQVSSVPHYCGFKEQETLTIYTVWMAIYWNSNVNILIFWNTDSWISLALSSNHQNKKK